MSSAIAAMVRPQRVLVFGVGCPITNTLGQHSPQYQITQVGSPAVLDRDDFDRLHADLVVCPAPLFRELLLSDAAGAAQASNGIAHPLEDIPPLTRRQREILALLVKGLSNTEIANLIPLSRRIVKEEVSKILMLFNVTNRTELATLVAESGFLHAS